MTPIKTWCHHKIELKYPYTFQVVGVGVSAEVKQLFRCNFHWLLFYSALILVILSVVWKSILFLCSLIQTIPVFTYPNNRIFCLSFCHCLSLSLVYIGKMDFILLFYASLAGSWKYKSIALPWMIKFTIPKSQSNFPLG